MSVDIAFKLWYNIYRMIITYHELQRLLLRAGSPKELLLHPDDYTALLGKFGSSLRGHDDKGEYLMFQTTKIRPNPQFVTSRPELVDWSAQSLEWL